MSKLLTLSYAALLVLTMSIVSMARSQATAAKSSA